MPEFTVELKNLKRVEDNFKTIRKIIQSQKSEVNSIANNLSLSGGALAQVQKALTETVNTLDSLDKSATQLGNGLNCIMNLYETTEKNIQEKTVIDSPPQTSDDSGDNVGNEPSNDEGDSKSQFNGHGRRRSIGRHAGGGRHRGLSEEAQFIKDYEYTYSENDIAVPICIEFLDKSTCLAMADRIIAEHGKDGKCNDMSRMRIAKELYAHAFGYFSGSALEDMGIDGEIAKALMESGDPANIGLGDGLDAHYNIIWYWMDPFDLDGYWG